MREIGRKIKSQIEEPFIKSLVIILLCAAIHLPLSTIVLAAVAQETCAKTFVTSKGRDVVFRKNDRPMSARGMRTTTDIEEQNYVVNNQTKRGNYHPIEPPSQSQNCAGYVMGRLFSADPVVGRLFSAGKYNFDVDALMDSIIIPYAGQEIVRIGVNGQGTERVEKGDILRYPSSTQKRGADHVAYVENVIETTDSQGRRRKTLIILSKNNEESIYEIDINPEEWEKDPLASPKHGSYSLPFVYRLNPGAVGLQEKYPGGGECDSEELVVEVVDKISNAGIGGAEVKVLEGGPAANPATGPDGLVKVRRYRGKDVKLTVSKNGYLEQDETVSSQVPSLPVFLEKKPDIDSVKNLLEGKIVTLMKLRDVAGTARESAEAQIGGSRAKDITDAKELLRLLNEEKKKIEQANNDCIQARSYITQATADASKAKTSRGTAITQSAALSSRVGHKGPRIISSNGVSTENRFAMGRILSSSVSRPPENT